MKIENQGNALPAGLLSDAAARTAKTAPEQSSSKVAQAASQTEQTSTSVSLGSTATQLGKMEASMANTPVVNASKVAEIRQAISEGRFQVNTGVVADKLIQSVQDLISNSGKRA